MSDSDDSAGVLDQVLLQPEYRLGVEVVGGLIEEEQIRSLEEKLAQCHTTPFATGEHTDRGIWRRTPQRVHRLLQLGIDIPGVGGVDLLLELTHLIHERVKIGVRVCHLHANRVIAVDLS